jgi:hypothetical protein
VPPSFVTHQFQAQDRDKRETHLRVSMELVRKCIIATTVPDFPLDVSRKCYLQKNIESAKQSHYRGAIHTTAIRAIAVGIYLATFSSFCLPVTFPLMRF